MQYGCVLKDTNVDGHQTSCVISRCKFPCDHSAEQALSLSAGGAAAARGVALGEQWLGARAQACINTGGSLDTASLPLVPPSSNSFSVSGCQLQVYLLIAGAATQ
jgi:hypothetical protein